MAAIVTVATIATLMPPMLVIPPMMIAIVEAFARLSDDATRYSSECDQPQQQTAHDR
jgi:hypothetical protein